MITIGFGGKKNRSNIVLIVFVFFIFLFHSKKDYVQSGPPGSDAKLFKTVAEQTAYRARTHRHFSPHSNWIHDDSFPWKCALASSAHMSHELTFAWCNKHLCAPLFVCMQWLRSPHAGAEAGTTRPLAHSFCRSFRVPLLCGGRGYESSSYLNALCLLASLPPFSPIRSYVFFCVCARVFSVRLLPVWPQFNCICKFVLIFIMHKCASPFFSCFLPLHTKSIVHSYVFILLLPLLLQQQPLRRLLCTQFPFSGSAAVHIFFGVPLLFAFVN